MRIRTCAASLALITAASGLAACSSTSGASDPSTSSSPPTTSAPASTVTSTASTTVAPSSTASSTSTNQQCAESQLRAGAKVDNIAGVDAHVVRLTFANISGSTCTLHGYPGAAIEDASNKQVQQAKRVQGGPIGGTIEKPRTLTLRPGSSAYAYLEGSSTREQGAAQAGCDGAKYPRILVTPPNTDTPVPFTVGWPLCYSFRIHPVRID